MARFRKLTPQQTRPHAAVRILVPWWSPKTTRGPCVHGSGAALCVTTRACPIAVRSAGDRLRAQALDGTSFSARTGASKLMVTPPRGAGRWRSDARTMCSADVMPEASATPPCTA